MPLVSTTEIERASKTALQAYGAKDWIAASVARAELAERRRHDM